jgi:hypothetical protein
VHMQGIFLIQGFLPPSGRFTEIKVSTTSELFSTTSELIPAFVPTFEAALITMLASGRNNCNAAGYSRSIPT